jgi:hypothetical protein
MATPPRVSIQSSRKRRADVTDTTSPDSTSSPWLQHGSPRLKMPLPARQEPADAQRKLAAFNSVSCTPSAQSLCLARSSILPQPRLDARSNKPAAVSPSVVCSTLCPCLEFVITYDALWPCAFSLPAEHHCKTTSLLRFDCLVRSILPVAGTRLRGSFSTPHGDSREHTRRHLVPDKCTCRLVIQP